MPTRSVRLLRLISIRTNQVYPIKNILAHNGLYFIETATKPKAQKSVGEQEWNIFN